MKGTQLYEDARKSGFNPMPKSLVERLDLPTLTTFDDERQALLVTSGLSLMPNLVKLEIFLGIGGRFDGVDLILCRVYGSLLSCKGTCGSHQTVAPFVDC